MFRESFNFVHLQHQYSQWTHFEKLRVIVLSQLGVECCNCSLQVLPLLVDFPLSCPQQLHLFLFLPLQALHVSVLLLIQEAVEVLELCPDLSFQVLKPVLEVVSRRNKKAYTCETYLCCQPAISKI